MMRNKTKGHVAFVACGMAGILMAWTTPPLPLFGPILILVGMFADLHYISKDLLGTEGA